MLKYVFLLMVSSSVFAQTATISCNAPTARVNGDLLLASEIKGYNFLLTKPDGTTETTFTLVCEYTTSDLQPGLYELSVQTEDNWGLQSAFTTPINADIIPAAPPNKPNNVRLRLEVMANGDIIISVPE